MGLDPRTEAFRVLQTLTGDEPGSVGTAAPHDLSALDQALFHELTQGICREFRFLVAVLNRCVKKKPRLKARNLLLLGAYQLLFFEKVPSYAIFSEVKKLALKERFSTEESKFIHGVLKSVERERHVLLKLREDALHEALSGICPSGDLGLDVLNLSSEIIDEISKAIVANGLSKALLWRALACLKEKSALVGYAWPGREAMLTANQPLHSSLAPHAIVFEDAAAMQQSLRKGDARIQGEPSQWACHQAAELLKPLKNPHVLEIAAGKGGKLFGTTAALARHSIGSAKGLHWTASDSSWDQIKILEDSRISDLTDLGVRVETLVWDWSRSDPPELPVPAFDLVWLDAPCSGLGTLAKHPEIAFRASMESIRRLAILQLKLLNHGWRFVKPGGALFYSLCTFSWSETFGVIEQFRQHHPEASVGAPHFLWPGRDALVTREGFFGILLTRPSA